MDVDTAAGRTSGATLAEGTGLALLLREVDGGAGVEGDAHLIGIADGAGIPVERKGGLGIAITVAGRPGLAVAGQILGTIADQIAGQVPPIKVDLLSISRRSRLCSISRCQKVTSVPGRSLRSQPSSDRE